MHFRVGKKPSLNKLFSYLCTVGGSRSKFGPTSLGSTFFIKILACYLVHLCWESFFSLPNREFYS